MWHMVPLSINKKGQFDILTQMLSKHRLVTNLVECSLVGRILANYERRDYCIHVFNSFKHSFPHISAASVT